MAIILEDRNVYIKVEKESENNLSYALIKEYANKEARELEKRYGTFKSYLVTTVQAKLTSYYDEMYTLATAIGFDESVVETYESTIDFCNSHPAFNEKYQQYHILFAEEQKLSEFLHFPYLPVPNLPVMYKAIIENQKDYPASSLDDFIYLLASSNPAIVEVRVSIPSEHASDIAAVYEYLKNIGIFKNAKDDL